MKGKLMIKYITFLRGINVGGKKVIRMEELQKLFEGAGHDKELEYREKTDNG
jgi:uncharacterized protein (DUF1697 family)